MRTLLLLGMTSLVSLALAQNPNQYECDGKTTRLTYYIAANDSDSFFTVNDKRFVGAEISRTGTPVGTLISVVTEAVPDLRTRHTTLVVPLIHLSEKEPEISFSSHVFVTEVRSSIGGRGLLNGLIQNSAVEELRCKARFINP